MIKKVEESLLQLEQEFTKLKSLVAYLDLAKEVVVENQSLTESFRIVKERAEELLNAVVILSNEIQAIGLPEIEERLQEKFSNLGISLENLNIQMVQDLDKIQGIVNSSSEKIESGLSGLVERFDTVEFAKRFAKADDALFTIQQSIINNQARIESFERNIKDEFDYKIKDVIAQIDKANSDFNRITESIEQKITQKSEELIQFIEMSKKQSRTQFVILLSLVIISIIIGALGLALR
jgi:hypothetical protein